MRISLFISLLPIFLLIACGNDSSEPPSLDRTDTIGGVDADKNGIRDDIDTYIKKTYPNYEQKKAVTQYARSLQASLLIDKDDEIAVKAATNAKAKAISCISMKVPDGKSPNGERVVREIVSITTNTKQRLLEYMTLDKALDGTVISLPSGDVCDE